MSVEKKFNKDLTSRINELNKEKTKIELLLKNDEINKKIKILDTFVKPQIIYGSFEEYGDEDNAPNVLWSSQTTDTLCFATFDFKKTCENEDIFMEIHDDYDDNDDICVKIYFEKEGYRFYASSFPCIIDYEGFTINGFLKEVEYTLPQEFVKNKLNKKICDAFEIYLNNKKDVSSFKDIKSVTKKSLEKNLMKVLNERMKKEMFK